MSASPIKLPATGTYDAAPKRVMAYCHDSVGVGHLRRTLAICQRVGANYPDCSFLLATGTPYVPLFERMHHVDCIKLPALAKHEGEYRSKFLSLPVDKLIDCRTSILLEAVKSYAPDVMLVDKAPLGVCRELLPSLEWLKRERPEVRTIFGMRDVEDAPQATIRDWTRDGVYDALGSCYDEIWVYGSRSVFDVVESYRIPSSIAEKIQYMGYITRPLCQHAPATASDPQKKVLITVGGGTDGERVLTCYLEAAAAAVAEQGAHSEVIGGPDLPAGAAERIRNRIAKLPNTRWRSFAECMCCQIRESDLIVMMGGYNTLCEVALQRKPAIVIPRTQPRLEQKIRADLWQPRGAIRGIFDCDKQTPADLARMVLDELQNAQQRTSPQIDLTGLDRVEARFQALWPRETSGETAVHVH